MNPKEELILLCSLFGSCEKKTQGQGGNISVKQGTTLWIKASGSRLSSVSDRIGYVECDIPKIHECYNKGEENLEGSVLRGPSKKPSMETFFHLLPKSHIVHIHPTFFCRYLCNFELKSIFSNFGKENTLYIPYCKPGLQLAQRILPLYKNESVIFLENHGIILLADSVESLLLLYDNTLSKLENDVDQKSYESSLSSLYTIYKTTNQIAKPVYRLPLLPDTFLPMTPDHFLFLQKSPLLTTKSDLEIDCRKWMQEKGYAPSVLQEDDQIYCLGTTFEQCVNKEEYLRSYFDIFPTASHLSEDNQKELLVCPKEIHRLSTQ